MHNFVIPTGAERSERSGGTCFLGSFWCSQVKSVAADNLHCARLVQMI